ASRRIPNWLTFPLLLAGLIQAVAAGAWAGLADALAAMLLLSFPYIVLYRLRGGAGDAKLMGALGAWLGLLNGALVLLCVSASGVVLAIAYAALHGYARQALANVRGIAYGLVFAVIGRGKMEDAVRSVPPSESMMQMPYGLVIVVGVCMAAVGVLV